MLPQIIKFVFLLADLGKNKKNFTKNNGIKLTLNCGLANEDQKINI